MNLGREKLSSYNWADSVWNRIDDAVKEEAKRTKVAKEFLPMHGPLPEALTVSADTIRYGGDGAGDNQNDDLLTVPEGEMLQLLETWVEFALTEPQVKEEEKLATAVTLATRATNMLAQAQDLLIFQGVVTALQQPLFTNKRVRLRIRANDDEYLLNTNKIVNVPAAAAQNGRLRYSEGTASAVAIAYGLLQQEGHYGPYALVLHTDAYSDTYEPLSNTLIMPADRIKPLVEKRFYGTGTLPARTGVFLSVGGNTMDLVTGTPPKVAVLQQDNGGRWRFRVFERFALRLKDASAAIKLNFETQEEFDRRGTSGEMRALTETSDDGLLEDIRT